ncbi:hypothetical protein PYW07_001424 [Mythimna separata]|uniref:Uncharacterized protein n=1 Tax=Mythimna separata TaxID=271217 RepID=A0AAD7YV88_MYTSE|nr:hypothetical protein PYW07_001424 [Mythimna separata]
MMRTYTRKRPHHELINDVHELCRLCLNKAEETMPIFTDDPNNICATVALRIMICVGLEVKKEECLPNVICTKCYNELNKYYAFRKKCEMTYQKLKSHVLAFKENLYKEKLLKEAEQKKKIEEEHEEGMKFVVTFEKDQFQDVNVLNLNGVAQVNNFVDHQSLPDLTKVDDSRAIEINVIEDTEQSQQSQNEEIYSPDIKAFLSTMLLELGILTQQEDGLVYSNQNITSLELENEDGSLVHLELVEEDDVEELPQVQEEVPEEPQDIPKEAQESSQENDIAIKYVTSNWSQRCIGRPKKVDNRKGAGAWCKECGKRLATRGALTRHMRTHSGEKPYACATCGRSFAQKEVMLRHVLVHEGRCCLLRQQWAGDCTHSGEKPYACATCGRSFAQKEVMLRHVLVHEGRRCLLRQQWAGGCTRSGEKPYACATCGRSFAQKEVMLRHVLVHEEDRPHKCSVCDKSFTQRGALVSHARAHAPPNARPLALHRCDRCPKVFLYASGLSRHMMMHNGRVYVCGACERQFKDKSSLMRHLRNANHEPRASSPT